jgi:hypothetical protein
MTGSSLLWSSFLGGSGDDRDGGLALDPSGSVVVGGNTTSTNFPTTPGAYDESWNGGSWDAFVSKLSFTTTAVGEYDGLGVAALLGQNTPNPFNPFTRIQFNITEDTSVSLRIYDLSGRMVKELLVNSPHQAGTHSVAWNGTDNSGQRLSSGIYFYRLEAGNHVDAKKMVLIK